MLHSFVNKMSDQEKKIFYFTILIVLVALVDRLFLGPVLERLKFIDDEIDQQKYSIQRDMRFLSYKDKIAKEGDIFSKYFAAKLPAEDEINRDFLSAVERLATQSSVALIKSNPADSRKKKDYVEYFADVDCSGELKNVITFMHAINSSDDLLKVVKFSMTPKKGTSNEVNASMSIVKLVIGPDVNTAEVKTDVKSSVKLDKAEAKPAAKQDAK